MFHVQTVKGPPCKQVMAPLPELRTQKSLRAFSQTSVDFAGPFYTKQGRGKTRHKRYLWLFTCLGTRAVHLEVAYRLDTDSFLNAFFRMMSGRGLPKDVLSDNGTNFVRADNELKELAGLDREKIQEKTACYGMKWHFNPPLAPHFSGVHEVMIKAAKKAIYAIWSGRSDKFSSIDLSIGEPTGPSPSYPQSLSAWAVRGSVCTRCCG